MANFETPLGNTERARRVFSLDLRKAVLALLLFLLLAAGWVVASRGTEDRILAAAEGHLRSGEPEAALGALEPLHGRPLLSSAARRRAAGFYFRLGEDRKAHALLRGQRFDTEDAEDLRLRDLAGRNYRAAQLLRRVERSHNPEERVRFLQAARKELPEAPRLLQRLVQEELLAMVRTGKPEHSAAFERDYLELRAMAPQLADEIKARVAEELKSEEVL